MAVYDLSKLVEGVQSCLDRAQQRSERRQDRLLQHLIEVGKDGEPESLSWVARLPSGDGGQRTLELIRLPWASLRNAEPMYVAKASIAFDCQVFQSHHPSTDQPSVLTVTPVSNAKKKSAHTHRLQISLSGGDGVHAQISLDDQLIQTCGSQDIPMPGKSSQRQPAGRRGSKRRIILKWIVILLLIGLLAAALAVVQGVWRLP